MLSHTVGISPLGTFWLFFAVTALGGVWVWFTVPETAGRSLETMDRLFDELPWYKIGLFGNRYADTLDQQATEKDAEAERNGSAAEKVGPTKVEVA